MIRNKKSVLVFFMITFLLGISSVIVFHLTGNKELLLYTRLIGSAFFLGVYLYTVSVIKKQEKMIKDSNGFLESPFNPSILKLMLLLFVTGWTTFSVLDYFGLNPVDWIVVFTMGIIIIPIASGLMPLWIKDNKWRRK